jgi:hypothetical protein
MTTKARADEGHRRGAHCGNAGSRLRIHRTLVTEDVTGTWYGSMGGPLRPRRAFVRAGATGINGQGVCAIHSGPISCARNCAGPIDGTMTGDVLRFNDARRSLEGELTVRGDEMNGMLVGLFGRRPLSLRRVDSSSGPVSPPR